MSHAKHGKHNNKRMAKSSDIPTNLHSASTLEIDRTVRECASLVNDSRLIGKLAPGDMVAIEAKYHAKCLVDL